MRKAASALTPIDSGLLRKRKGRGVCGSRILEWGQQEHDARRVTMGELTPLQLVSALQDTYHERLVRRIAEEEVP